LKPHELEIEALKALVGEARLSPRDAVEVLDETGASAADCEHPHARATWVTVEATIRAGGTLDAVSVAARCHDVPRAFVVDIVTAKSHLGISRQRLSLLRTASLRRQYVQALRAVAAVVTDEAQPLANGVAEAARLLASWSDESSVLRPLDESVGALVDELEAVAAGTRTGTLPTGIDALDAVIGGLQPTLTVVGALPGVGKCLGLGEKVLRFDGSVAMVEDIKAGDLLMGPDSAPRRVLATTRGVDELFRITPVRGDPWVCNSVHVLTLKHTTTGATVDIALDEYLRKSAPWKHRHKQFSVGVDFGASEDALPIDPYFLGIWLGDGTKCLDRHGRVAKVAVTKPDAEIQQACEATAQSWGLRVRCDVAGGGCPTFNIVNDRGQGNHLLDELRVLMSGRAIRVPRKYLVASRAARLEVLAGLIDTDGHLEHGCIDFVQKSAAIIEDATFLARSLGLKVTNGDDKVVNGETYLRICISGDLSCVPTRIHRKTSGPRRQKKDALRTGFAVESIGRGEYAGFELDGDGRFLLGDFTVTHNSALVAGVLRNLSSRGVVSGLLSLEDERLWLTRRLLAHAASVPVFVLANKPLARSQQERVLECAPTLHAMLGKVLCDDRPGLTSSEVVASARRMVARGAKAVLVDHLGEIRLERTDRHDLDISDALRDLRSLAKSHRVPVVVLTHLRRREGLTVTDEPRLTDFAFSSGVERMARVALGLYRSDRDDELRCAVLKQTQGVSGVSVTLRLAAQAGVVVESPAPKADLYGGGQ